VAENARALPESTAEAIAAPRGFWNIGRLALGKGLGFQIVPSAVLTLLRLGLGVLAWVGVFLLLVRRQWFIPANVAGITMLVCSAPWPSQMLRYLGPIVPLLTLAFLAALLGLHSRVARYLRARPFRFAPAVTAGGILVLQLGSYVVSHSVHRHTASYRTRSGASANYRQLWYRQPDQALDESIDWIRAHAQPGDIVAASMPHWIFLRTGLKAVMPPFEVDPINAQKMLDSVPVRYLVQEDPLTLTNIAAVYMGPMLNAFPDGWRVVHVSPGSYVRVYERVRSGGDSRVLD
jgi:hypothetical protein